MKEQAISREQVDTYIVRTVYKKANSIITVKSIFNGTEKLEDLLYQAIQRKLQDTYNDLTIS